MTSIAGDPEARDAWSTWTASEREDFFVAIARHRRAAWRVSVASTVAIAVLAVIVATLMSPVFYAAIALALDVANLIAKSPNIVEIVGNQIGPAFDEPAAVPLERWLQLSGFAALPGLVWMALIVLALRRMLRTCATPDGGIAGARACNPAVLAEQRFANVIGEMAVAANLPAPRIFVIASASANAVVLGIDEKRASILVSTALLARLKREELQGIAGQLIGALANGDVGIGLHAALALSLFGLNARLSGMFTDPGAAQRLCAMGRALLMPSAERAQQLAAEIADPFASSESKVADERRGARRQDGDWRRLIWLPLAGPIVITGFFAGIASFILLGPLVSLAWRQRKYMADATAVRLTRDPDALSKALEKMSGSGEPLAAWASHLSIVQSGGNRTGVLGASFVPMFPSIERRLAALAKLGAHLSHAPRHMPRRLVLILAPLFAVAGLLMIFAMCLLIFLSTALTMLFTGLPFGVIHLLLRSLGH